MVRDMLPIDITGIPELARLADEVARTRTPRALHRGGEEVAVLMPPRPGRRRARKRITQADIEAARAAFGGWRGHVDAERFKREIKTARSDHRPPVAR